MTPLLPYSKKNFAKHYWPEAFILCLAAAIRLFGLEIKPPHFDEGVNGWFSDQMKLWGYYRYDPTNYHGPFYFYLIYLFKALFGRELWALRMPAVIASIFSVAWMFRFTEFFGRRTAMIAAAAMAVSPAYVFYGRYSIHESWLVFFTIIFIWGFLGLWEKGSQRYLSALLVGLSGIIITKETWIISVIALLLAFGCLLVWQKVIPSDPELPWAKRCWTNKDMRQGALILSFVFLIFYSGFFQNFSGIPKFFEAFSVWLQTGFGELSGHEKKAQQSGVLNYYWIYLIGYYEWPSLVGLLACFLLIGRAAAQKRFLALYAVGVLCAYSIIPYKTPWLIISLLWPLFFFLGEIPLSQISKASLQKVNVFIGLLLLGSLFLCLRLNFFHPTDEKEPYVYVQTYPEIHTFTDPPLTLAYQDARYYNLRGMILLESYYPIPWLLGDFLNLGYYNKKENWPKLINADFFVTLASEMNQVEKLIQEPYYKRQFRLRNGMGDCMAYFRAALFGEYFGGSPEVQPLPVEMLPQETSTSP